MSNLSDRRGAHATDQANPVLPQWLISTGRIATEIAERDWGATPLGPLETWPVTLRTTLSLILNSGLSMFIAWGEDLLSFYNDAYAPVLAGKEDTLGRPFHELFPEAWPRVGPLFYKAMAGETSYFEEFSVTIDRAGELQESWWTFSYSPIVDQAGRICGVFGPVYETTARVQAEARLRQSEANLQKVSDIVPNMLWRTLPDGQLIWMNRQMADYFGPDGPWNNHWENVHPDDRALLDAEWRRARREGSAFHNYHRLKDAEGSYRWHVASFEPWVGGSGEIEEWVGAATDIHDMRIATEALAESEARFRSFANNSADTLWIADVQSGLIEYHSPAFHTIWGEPPQDAPISWDYWLSTVHPDDRGRQEQALDRLLAGEVLHEEYRIVRGDDTVRWIRDTMFPVVGRDGVIRKVGGIAQDITRENRLIVHLIDAGNESRSMLTQRLQAIGYQVRPFASVNALLRVSRALLPGCVLFYDHDGGVEANRLASALKDQLRSLPVVLVGDVRNPADVVGLMKHGVSDIVFPSDPEGRLEEALATALAAMRSGMREDDAAQVAKDKVRSLTDREREILTGLSSGATNKIMGRDLGLSPRTVETYRFRILERLGVSSLPEAIKLAAIAGL